MVTLDCPKCGKLDAFEMIQWDDKATLTVGWDINIQQCDCEITLEMESELGELADDEATNLSFDDAED